MIQERSKDEVRETRKDQIILGLVSRGKEFRFFSKYNVNHEVSKYKRDLVLFISIQDHCVAT